VTTSARQPVSVRFDLDMMGSRFLGQARVAATVPHPNIISVYDFGEDQGLPSMVIEFLQGEDLRTLIKTEQAPATWDGN
jgi:serine/threonine protein kinase